MKHVRGAMIVMRFWQALAYFYVPACNAVTSDYSVASISTQLHTFTHTTCRVSDRLMHIVPRSVHRTRLAVVIATHAHATASSTAATVAPQISRSAQLSAWHVPSR